jgi:hypothetical protein
MLMLQKIITVEAYEYIFAFQFTQNAATNYEVPPVFSQPLLSA